MRMDDTILNDKQKQLVKPHTAEIIGIFEIETAMGVESGNSAECDIEKNFIFTDTAFARDFYEDIGSHTGAYLDGVSFFVKDPKELDRVVASLTEIGDYNWDGYAVTKNNKTYEDSALPLERLSKIVSVMVFVIAGISAVMLSLILFLWMRDRVHEIGVYLSLGKKRSEILWQHMLENLLVAAAAFIVAWGICQITSKTVEQAVGTAFFAETEQEAEMQTEPPELVEIGVIELLEVAGIGALIIILSTGISSLLVLRMRPKDILSLMS